MKKVLVATFALALVTATAGPAYAAPAKQSRASAYGLESTGLIDLGPFAPTSAAYPPGTPSEAPPRDVVLELSETQPLVADATVGSVSEAHLRDDIASKIKRRNPDDAIENPVTQQGNNASGFATTDGLSVLVNVPGLLDPLTEDVEVGLVGAEAVDAEVVVKCVGDRPVFDAGYNELEVALGGSDLEPVEGAFAAALDLLGIEGPLSDVISIERGETNVRPDGTLSSGTVGFINGLHIRSELLGLDIIVSHAEAAMPQDCGFDCSDLRDNDGDRKIDVGPDPGCDSDIDDDERDPVRTGPPGGPALAATGNDMGVWPLMAFGVLGAAVIVRRTTLRSSRKPS